MWIVKILNPLNQTDVLMELMGETVKDIMNDYTDATYPNGKWLNESIIRNTYAGRNNKDRYLIHVEKE
tara:strand:- start:4005 stop:4208 length:204 start_codon:yes stop_codon:yes gene_type:complete